MLRFAKYRSLNLEILGTSGSLLLFRALGSHVYSRHGASRKCHASNNISAINDPVNELRLFS